MILADEYILSDNKDNSLQSTPYSVHVSHKDNIQGTHESYQFLVCAGDLYNIVWSIPSPDTYPNTPDLHIKESTAELDSDGQCQVHPVPHTENTVPLSRLSQRNVTA